MAARPHLRLSTWAHSRSLCRISYRSVGATKPILVGHSIGGMIVQQLLAKSPDIATAIVLAQTSPAFGRPDGDWQKSFLQARLGPLDRGETMDSLAPTL